MSVEAILGRMQSEATWMQKYQALPYENQQGEGIKKQYEGKKLYVMELQMELASRHAEKGKSLAPVIQRTLELTRTGTSEAQAKEQALKEFIAERDSAK